MNKKGIANIYWFAMAIFIIILVGIAWMSTATPLEYTAETGRKQAIIFNMYITAEQIRNYVEESAKLSTFYALREMGVAIDDATCFNNVNDVREFSEVHFTQAMELYLELFPLENQYSDMIAPIYGVFWWDSHVPNTNPITDQGTLTDTGTAATSKLEVQDAGATLEIIGIADGDIMIINQRYLVIYEANPNFRITVTCQQYEDFMEDL